MSLLAQSVSAQRSDPKSTEQVFIPTKKNGVVTAARATNDRPASEHVPAKKGKALENVEDSPGQATQFVDYPGAQAAAWPIVPKPVLLPNFSMPVYKTHPDRQYDVLGFAYVRFRPYDADPRSAAIKLLIEISRLRQADALVLLPHERGPVPYYAGATAVKWRGR